MHSDASFGSYPAGDFVYGNRVNDNLAA